MFYRHDAYWGAPRPGFCYDSPRMDFGPRPMHHGNPFGSFMGGFFGGLGMAAACGWGNSYVSYPGSSVSIFPRSYSPYQSYSAAPSFGYDCSAFAFNDAYARFVNACSSSRYTTAPTQTPTSNWAMSASGWTMPSFGQTWSQPFSSLTQSARSEETYSIIPTKPKTQTSAQSGSSQQQSSGEYTPIPFKNTNTATSGENTYTPIPVNNAAPAGQGQQVGITTPNQGAQSSASAVGAGTTEATLIIGDASKGSALNESSVLEAAKSKGMNAEVQRYQEIMSGLEQTSKPSLENVNPSVYNGVSQQQQIVLSAMQEGNTETVNDNLNSLSTAVKKYQAKYSIPEPPKDAATIKAEEEAFYAKCPDGGDCGDAKDRMYYDKEKGEWVKSTKTGYTKQPIAPDSTLAEIPGLYNLSAHQYIYLNSEALEHFKQMSDAAFREGIPIGAISAQRSEKYQQVVLEQEGPGVAAPPGYTEHHNGLTVDINLYGLGKNSPQYKWLKKHAREYGFEASYPKRDEEAQHWRFNRKLLEKYGKASQETQTSDSDTAGVSEGEDVFEIAKSKGMSAEVQKYNEIMDGFDQSSNAPILDRYLANAIAKDQEKLMNALEDQDKDSCKKHLDSLAKLVKEYKKISGEQEGAFSIPNMVKVNNSSEAAERAKTILSTPVPTNKQELNDQIFELNSLSVILHEVLMSGAINVEVANNIDERVLKMQRILNSKVKK